MLEIFTIGHSNRPWKDFLALLRAHGIARVIDVRTIPRSRHNPQFGREILSRKLRSSRVAGSWSELLKSPQQNPQQGPRDPNLKFAYVHLPQLGGLRHARRDSPNRAWRNASFRGYADYMQTPEFEAGLRRLIKLARGKRSAIMCAEAVPWRCHRSLIADALLVRGVRVADIFTATRARPHQLTPFARVRGKRITYPLRPAEAKAPQALTNA